MKNDTGTSIKIPIYTKDIIDNIRATRRSKVNGKCIDGKQLTQCETLVLMGYYFVSNNERYKEIISMEFDMELVKKLTKIGIKKNG